MQPRRASAYLTLASASASPPGDRRQYSLIVFSQNAAVGESYFDPRADHFVLGVARSRRPTRGSSRPS